MALRPGVTITTQYRSAAESEAYPLAVYAKAAKTANGIQFIQSKAQAVAVFGEDTDQSPLTRLLFLCLEGGAGGVWAMCRTAETQSELETEFSAFLATQGEFLITDLSQQSQIQFMAQALEEGGMRKILFAAGDVSAEQINSMRCVLACPQGEEEPAHRRHPGGGAPRRFGEPEQPDHRGQRGRHGIFRLGGGKNRSPERGPNGRGIFRSGAVRGAFDPDPGDQYLYQG